MTLHTLRDKLKAATGPSLELDQKIGSELLRAWTSKPPRYTDSVDAALGLLERVLPDTMGAFTWGTNLNKCTIVWNAVERHEDADIYSMEASSETAPTPALAICLAIVEALIEQG